MYQNLEIACVKCNTTLNIPKVEKGRIYIEPKCDCHYQVNRIMNRLADMYSILKRDEENSNSDNQP